MKYLIFSTLCLLFSQAGFCARVTHDFVIQVSCIDEMSINTSGLITLKVNSAVAGREPDPAEASTTYNITTNEDHMKIVGRLSDRLPTGLTLQAKLDPPNRGSSSTGYQTLSTSNVNLVRGISEVAAKNIPFYLRLTSGVSAGIYSIRRDIILTIQSE